MAAANDHQAFGPQQNYPLNLWWVAARSEEVTRVPMSRRILERPIVLYRTTSGQAVALEDRCMHRWAPLSQGYVEGDNLVCGYHGAVFSVDGRCSSFPQHPTVPSTAAVRSYTVIEHDPFVWICLGDPSKAPELPPQFPWFRDPEWLVASGAMPFAANYFLLQENVLDLTHFNFAHRKSFGVTDQPIPAFKREGSKVFFELFQEECKIPKWRREAMNLGDQRVSRRMRTCFETPAYHCTDMDIVSMDAPAGAKSRFKSWVIHCVTPEGPDRSHYWWLNGSDVGPQPESLQRQLQQDIDTAFDEDKAFLEGIQRVIRDDPRHLDAPEVSFKSDLGGIQARRVLQEMLSAERNTTR